MSSWQTAMQSHKDLNKGSISVSCYKVCSSKQSEGFLYKRIIESIFNNYILLLSKDKENPVTWSPSSNSIKLSKLNRFEKVLPLQFQNEILNNMARQAVQKNLSKIQNKSIFLDDCQWIHTNFNSRTGLNMCTLGRQVTYV